MKTYIRRTTLVVSDLLLINLAIFMALIFRFDGSIPSFYLGIYLKTTAYLSLIKLIVYGMFGLYKSLWRYASIDELLQLFFAVAVESVLTFLFGQYTGLQLPRSVYAISGLLTFLFIGGSRFSLRITARLKNIVVYDMDNKARVLVVGAGEAGSIVIKELKKHIELNSIPVAVVDDDKKKHGANIHGVPVKGGRDAIKRIIADQNIDEIIIALPSVPKSELKSILQICKDTKCKLKMLPGVYEIIDEKVSINAIRDVNIEDLLGRDPVRLNTEEIASYITDETILVSGGGGSIGSELCRQIARFNPKKLIILDIYENNAYDLQHELKHTYKDKLQLEVLIGSVRDKQRMEDIYRTYKPGVVFHAAAHKHVPLMEVNPAEAIKNNVLGTLNMAQCSDSFGVKKFILISTDKAVNPTNVMGATKRIAEMIVQSMDRQSKTEFAAVRFGNVLGSNGSVIPLFKKQIAQGGPVTVTDPEITRFFMTIPEAAQLVIQAGAMAEGGEIFILDMGQSVKIVDLAKDLIRLSGFEPDIDIKIVFTGLRPGEKLYEELLLAEEGIEDTRHKSIFIGKPLEISHNEVLDGIKSLENCLGDSDALRRCLNGIVTTYSYDIKEVAATK